MSVLLILKNMYKIAFFSNSFDKFIKGNMKANVLTKIKKIRLKIYIPPILFYVTQGGYKKL